MFYFYSSHIFRLSIIPLLRPFIWQGPFIPILPSSLSEYLQAPVPLICGVLELSQNQLSELKEAFILNVDSSEAILPSTGIVQLPHLKTLGMSSTTLY
jgi:hypothetical protein